MISQPRFLVKRLKEDAQMAEFGNRLSSNGNLKAFFPETYSFMEATQKYGYWSFTDFREASIIDIANLPTTILT